MCCETCEHCVAGEWNLCRRGGDLVGLGRDGGLAGWVDVPLANLVPAGERHRRRRSACSPSRWPSPCAASPSAGCVPTTPSSCSAPARSGCSPRRSLDMQTDRRRRLGPLRPPAASRRGTRRRRRRRDRRDGVGQERATERRHRDRRRDGVDARHRALRRPSWRHDRVLGTFPRREVDLFVAQLKEVAIQPSYAYGTTDGTRDFVTAAAAIASLRDVLPAVVTHRGPAPRRRRRVPDRWRQVDGRDQGRVRRRVAPTRSAVMARSASSDDLVVDRARRHAGRARSDRHGSGRSRAARGPAARPGDRLPGGRPMTGSSCRVPSRRPGGPPSARPARRWRRRSPPARRGQLVDGRRRHPPERDRGGDVAAEVGEGELLQRAEHEPAGPQRARQRMPAAAGDEVGRARR